MRSMYFNGFQHLPIDSSFTRELALYDENLLVWKEGQYYKISHSPKRHVLGEYEQYEYAKNNQVITIQDESGDPREPNMLDFELIFNNDLSRQSVKDIIARLNSPQEQMKEKHKKDLEDMIQQAMLDLKRDMALHPHKY